MTCWDSGVETRKEPFAAAVKTTHPEIYVDGSFADGQTGYGVVAIQNDSAIWEDSGTVPLGVVEGSRQVAGELQAVMTALKWCADQGFSKVIVCYDYEGIEKWARGEWKTNKPLTKRYKETVANCGIEISWKKIDAHTGVKWNERADELANTAARQAGAKTAVTADPIVEMDSIVASFAEYLKKFSMTVAVKQRSASPSPHTQVAIKKGDESWGHLNLYASDGNHPYPRFHEIKTDDKRQQMESMWEDFQSPPADELEEVNRYYAILEPYSNLRLDFGILAYALIGVWNRHMDNPISAADIRYDFRQMKECYQDLRRRLDPEIDKKS
jgi:ribonuclease HI